MPDLEEIFDRIRGRLDERDAVREEALRLARSIARDCRDAISSIQNNRSSAEGLKIAREKNGKLVSALEHHPSLASAGYVIGAQQEFAEAELLSAIICENELPTPEDLRVSDEAYLLGLADAIGELRRVFLTRLMDDEIERAREMLTEMERCYSMLMTLDYPDAIFPAKRKQDIARSLLEKSRGEMALAMQMTRFRQEID